MLDDGTSLLGQPAVNTLAAGHTITWQADGAIGMKLDALVQTNDVNIRLVSTAGDSTVGEVDAGTASISIRAGGAILDAQTGDDANPTVNLTAAALRLDAGAGIGSGAGPIQTAVGTVAALALGSQLQGVFLCETHGVTVEDATVTVNRVLADRSAADHDQHRQGAGIAVEISAIPTIGDASCWAALDAAGKATP